jgi:glycerol-3-phosphate acyltransferase PlsY
LTNVILGILLVTGAYAAGALPWGVVLGRWWVGVDLRHRGSGATGATNALRVLGWRISLAVLALDFAKGLLPVLIGRWLGVSWWVIAAAGLASVLGHCWSPFIRFTGGKGVATGAGAAIGLVPWVLLVLPVMVAIVAITRYMSLASLAGYGIASLAVLTSAVIGDTPWPTFAMVLGMTAVVVYRHRGNIHRLLNGTERRVGMHA